MLDSNTSHIGEPHSEWLCQLFPGEYAALKLYARSIVRDETAAEDIVSQAILKLMERMAVNPGMFTNYGDVRAYLYTSVRNACYDHLRGRKMVDADDPGIAPKLSDNGKLVHELEKRDLRNTLIRLIDRLPEQLRKVADLFFVQGATQEEVEQQLQLKSDVVYVYKNRALKMLKAMALDKDQALSTGDTLLILLWLASQL